MQHPFEAELIKTSDGSHTLKLKGHDEQYHSLNGAVQESQHVFLKSGLEAFSPLPNPFFVLEAGMGTGLNALLTGREALIRKTPVFYDAIEPYPLHTSLTRQLNYPALFPEPWVDELFNSIHSAEPGKSQNIQDYFFFKCFRQKLQDIPLDAERYHLVYFDAFGPDTQPEMWEAEVFANVFRSMKPGGVLVTYCVKGAVRRAMKAAGFEVNKIPGPMGKREMSRAYKPLAIEQKAGRIQS